LEKEKKGEQRETKEKEKGDTDRRREEWWTLIMR
jgi:hypothetical protein